MMPSNGTVFLPDNVIFGVLRKVKSTIGIIDVKTMIMMPLQV